jgi:tripartite-type tricarboxylate transporter receptor subunit TctC
MICWNGKGHRGCRLASGLVVFCLTGAVCMAAYPDRPIRFIVPSSAGSGPDVIARIFAHRLTAVLGQQVVVDNRAGANSIIGSELVARAAPDGYTLLITSGSHTINPHVYRKLPYDSLNDFTPISEIVKSSGLVLVVHPTSPLRSVQALVDAARAAPGKYSYASAGVGNLQHLAGEMFCQMAGVKITHVPYKGGGAAINDVLANQIAMNFASSPASVPFVKTDRLRGLAFTGLKRTDQLPEVPTLDESGLAGYSAYVWLGLLAPKGTPAPIIERLHRELVAALGTPEVKNYFNGAGIEAVGSTPAEFEAYFREERDRWARVVKESGARIE